MDEKKKKIIITFLVIQAAVLVSVKLDAAVGRQRTYWEGRACRQGLGYIFPSEEDNFGHVTLGSSKYFIKFLISGVISPN